MSDLLIRTESVRALLTRSFTESPSAFSVFSFERNFAIFMEHFKFCSYSSAELFEFNQSWLFGDLSSELIQATYLFERL